ncbi:MAG: class I SAM-dependent methyltransferase [Nocardioidaceae bacterium]
MDSASWDERYSGAELVWGTEPNQFVREHCAALPVGEAIDLACGEGRNALWLARRGWHVVGVDFSSLAIERAQTLSAAEPERVALHLDWVVADITTQPIKPQSVDLALFSYVHLSPDERDRLLVRAAGALKPRGHLLLVGHDLRNLTEGGSGPQDPELLFRPEQVRALLETLPYLTVELAQTLPRVTESGTALDTVVRARRDVEGSHYG